MMLENFVCLYQEPFFFAGLVVGAVIACLFMRRIQKNTAIFQSNPQSSPSIKALHNLSDTLSALDQLPWPLWLRNNNDLLWCNPAYARLFGLNSDEVLLQQKKIDEFWQGHGERNFLPFPLTLIVDGERRSFKFFEVIQQAHMFLGYGIDLTTSEEHKAQLESHVVAYREVLDNLSAGVTIYGPDKRLKYFNYAYLRMFDFEESWLYAEPTLGEVLDNLRARRLLTEYVDYAAYKKEQMDGITTLIAPTQSLLHLPDGRTFRIIAAPHPMGGSFYISEDVTNSLNLERKFNTQLAVQKASLDNLYEGIAVFGSDNRLRLFNAAFARIWHLTSEQVKIGRHLSDFVEDVKEFFSFTDNWTYYKSKLIDQVTNRLPKQQRIHRSNGSVLEFSYIPLPDGSNLMSYIDVTDSCQIEKLLRERNEALVAADKLKSDFIANVSYEFRTPLNSINGFIEILSNQYFGTLNKQQLKYCHNILAASQNLLSVVNDILDLAMIQAGYMKITKTTVSISDLMQHTLQMVQQKISDKRIKIRQTIEPQLKRCEVDESRIIQALYNILLSAIKSTPEEGIITISIGLKDDDVIISINDTGQPIQTKNHKRLLGSFTPMITNPEKSKITGLGITLVQSIIELHGGKIAVQSDPPHGTTVVCYIPCISASSLAPPLKQVA